LTQINARMLQSAMLANVRSGARHVSLSIRFGMVGWDVLRNTSKDRVVVDGIPYTQTRLWKDSTNGDTRIN
jgi:hypothetical protein